MGFFEALKSAFILIVQGDRELLGIIFLTLRVSGSAVIFAALLGIPLGAIIGLKRFPGKRIVVNLVNTFMGLPPVVAGLVVYVLISKNGALGELNLIFTPQAMMLAQIILCTPIITGLVGNAVENVEPAVIRTAMTLGADSKQVALTVLREQRYAIYAAIVTGFGRVIAEVGAVMLVGGNIRYSTRVMTTAIVLETRRGNYAFALSLGVILLLIAFIINILLSFFNRKGRAY